MEFVGQPRPSGACNLLGVPGLSSFDVDDDECEVVIGIRPKSSPLPRRRSSGSDEDSEPDPPLSGSRRVSFADAKGLSLVQVKEFDTWDVPKLPDCDPSEGERKDPEEFFISPLTFSLSLSTEELFVKVQEQKIELETIELLPGTTILKGVIRVLNISFNKAVYVRTTLDSWSSHFDLLAEYMPGSSDSLTDRFSFKLTLVPPFGEQGARVDFCLRFETSMGTFWANNNDRNYVLFCHQRAKERKERPQKENVNKKSCLKIIGTNFSPVENISAAEGSSQENISTDVSKHGEEADTMKAKQISEGQSGTSETDQQKLLTKSRQNCNRRSRREAARLARMRDYISQRNGGPDDTERDGSPPEATLAAQEATSEERHSDVRTLPEGSSKLEGSPCVFEILETCSEPVLDVQHDTSPAHDYASNSKTGKSESVNLADSTTLTGGESATDMPDNPLHSNDEPAPAECQNVSKAEEIAAELADNVISSVSNKSLVSQTDSYTFGTVVAPLYHQVFGRVGSESDWGNPIRPTLNVGDLTQSYPHNESRQTVCIVPTDARSNNDIVLGYTIETEESNQEFLDAVLNSPPTEEQESLSVTENDILVHEEALQDPEDIIYSDQRHSNISEVPKTTSGDAVIHPHDVHISNTDLLNPQIQTESLHLQDEAQEDNLIQGLQLAEPAQSKTNLEETLAQSETQEVETTLETSFMSLQPSQSETDQQASGSGANDCKSVHWSNKADDNGKTAITSTVDTISQEDKPLKALFDLTPKRINNSATKETESRYGSCSEFMEENASITPPISLETTNAEEGNNVVNNSHKNETKHSADIKVIDEVAESMTKATKSNPTHGDMFVGLKDEDTGKQEVFGSADTTEVNWEMMVEEEEKEILKDEEKSKAIHLKTLEKEPEQLEDAGRETASENKDTAKSEKEKKEDKTVYMVQEITTAHVLVDKQRIGEEETVDKKDGDEGEKELEYDHVTKAAEEKPAEEIEIEKSGEQEETELDEEKHLAEIQEVNIERTNVQDEEEIEEEEEMEIDLYYDEEAGVEWEDWLKIMEENAQEENPDYKGEILADVTVESESVAIEERQNEKRLDITQNKVEDGLSVPVNNVQDKRVIDNKNGHLLTEMHPYREGDFQSNKNVTHDLSKVAMDENESVAAEGGSCIFTDDPESDQTSQDSASAESDSDDEVELYMHCLRAVHAGAQAQKDRNKDTGFSVGRRPSVSKSKLLSTPMPSISESLDEEQHLGCLQDNHEGAETADIQLKAAALAASSGRESINRNVSRWKETFSCSNISKTLLYGTLFVVFLIVAYRFDFLACFGLYLLSVVWLYCQGERQPEQQKHQQNRLT